MNTLSIIILVSIIIFTVFVIIYLFKHKENSCGCCNGDCKKCKRNYKNLLTYYKNKEN